MDQSVQNKRAARFSPPLDGWLFWGHGGVYVSASSFTVLGDQTQIFFVGRKLKLTNSTVKYFVVVSSSYSAPNTTVTIYGGTDYVLVNGAITSIYFSDVDAYGYPQWFSYTPTWGAVSVNPALGNGSIAGKFRVIGKDCHLRIYLLMGSGTTYGTGFWYFLLPIAVYNDGGDQFLGVCHCRDAAAASYMRSAQLSMGAYTDRITYFAEMQADTNDTQLSGTVPFTWATGDSLVIDVSYRIAA